MKFVVDRNIPHIRSLLHPIGEVVEVETTDLTAKVVRDADVLLIRSETRVDRHLLEYSRVKFVGTATIGTDHVDLDYLASQGIAFANAPGCNANAVKEYIVAALLHFANANGFTLKGKVIGVVGIGNIGSRVLHAAEALGMSVIQNDPPLARQTGEMRFRPLNELMEADVISLHVPLTTNCPDATYHLFDHDRFCKLKKGTIFINTSRGAVVDTRALKEAIREKRVTSSCIDVWEDEPNIDADLLAGATIGTAHIAGHSMDGKINAVRILHAAVCRHFGILSFWNPPSLGEMAERVCITPPQESLSVEELLHRIVVQCYDIASDDTHLRPLTALPPVDRAPYFMKLRSQYRVRREFPHFAVSVQSVPTSLVNVLRDIGFASMNSGVSLSRSQV